MKRPEGYFLFMLIAVLACNSAWAGKYNLCVSAILRRTRVNFEIVQRADGTRIIRPFDQTNFLGKLLNGVAIHFKNYLKLEALADAFSRVDATMINRQFFQTYSNAFGLEVLQHGKIAPNVGPTIFIANHPMSGIDTFAIGAVLETQYPTLKVIAASHLQELQGFRDHAFIFDLNGGETAQQKNRETMKEVQKHVESGGAILLFPAGTTSALNPHHKNYAIDPPWKEGLSSIIRTLPQSISASIVPIFVSGSPSSEFLRLKKIDTGLSGAIIFRELANQVNRRVDLFFGEPILTKTLARQDGPTITRYFRAKLYELGTQWFQREFRDASFYPGAPQKPPLVTQQEYETLIEIDAP